MTVFDFLACVLCVRAGVCVRHCVCVFNNKVPAVLQFSPLPRAMSEPFAVPPQREPLGTEADPIVAKPMSHFRDRCVFLLLRAVASRLTYSLVRVWCAV